jgi:hypothetical protein
MSEETKKTSEGEETKKVISDRALQLSADQAPDYSKGLFERMSLAEENNNKSKPVW